jgi:hypothetical protein
MKKLNLLKLFRKKNIVFYSENHTKHKSSRQTAEFLDVKAGGRMHVVTTVF